MVSDSGTSALVTELMLVLAILLHTLNINRSLTTSFASQSIFTRNNFMGHLRSAEKLETFISNLDRAELENVLHND